jgi:hypothetical protein
MVVIETKSEIVELNGHQSQHNNGEHFIIIIIFWILFFIKETINLLHRLLIFDSKCSKLVINGFVVTTFIHEGYMRLKPLLYPCTIEFSLMCLTVSSIKIVCLYIIRIAFLSHLGKYKQNICS